MELQKIYTDSDFSSAIVPDGQILLFNAIEDGKPVTRYKDSNGNFGTLSGSGGSADYYKCASVDTANKTWTGYKAVITDGIWSFAETNTVLPYTKLLPAVGKVYDAECTFMVSGFDIGLAVPQDGLIAYMPLPSDFEDVTGNVPLVHNNAVIQEFKGKNGLKSENSTYAQWDISSKMSGSGVFSFMLFTGKLAYSGWGTIAALGGNGNKFSLLHQNNGVRVDQPFYGETVGYLTEGQWSSLAITRDENNVVRYYVDGTLSRDDLNSGQVWDTSGLTVGYVLGSSDAGNSYVRDVCLYDRVLSADEIAEIHNKLI